jgi:enoyl-[acyl-carrier protein] reductase III
MEKRGGGYIVSLSSPGATRVLKDYVVVGASKAAIEAITRYLAIEFAEKNIVVNAIAPGIVDTEALRHFAKVQEEGFWEQIATNNPLGRLVTPEDVANVAGFLCTPAAAMIRGQTITVDGGYTLIAD